MKVEKRGNGHKLTITKEDALLQWILSLDKRGEAFRPASVRDLANILLSECKPSDPQYCVGKNWVYKFINCHKELETQYLQRYNH